ncbi:SirB2 family protein [Undibacterium sp. RuRC25W]|uniref:SirB2 family protein n=1 Tax=Undibacterium sp. RuRC25W TaxID=3413047 RepID=UPI003BEFF544
MDYQTIKHIHITCAMLSGSLFFIRGCWTFAGSRMLEKRWVNIAPHLIDTLLLTTALIMVAWSQQYPFVTNWITAKISALFLYIMLGSLALKRGKTKNIKITTFIMALTIFFYIIAVAITKQVLPFLQP